VSIDERLVRAMKGWHTARALSIELREDYAKVLFGLERLKQYGFTTDDDDYWSLTTLGYRLKRIITTKPTEP
jgi:hypothetical protein